jgi:hypothetical protein
LDEEKTIARRPNGAGPRPGLYAPLTTFRRKILTKSDAAASSL